MCSGWLTSLQFDIVANKMLVAGFVVAKKSQKKNICGNFSFSFTLCVQFHNDVFMICNPGARIEEFIYDKLDKKLPSRTTNPELLGQYMLEAANEFGPGTPYGQWCCY